MPQFDLFSDDWFLMLERSNKKYDELNISALMKSINLNISLVESDQTKNLNAEGYDKFDNSKMAVLEIIDDTQTILQLKFCAGYLSKSVDNITDTVLVFSVDTLKELSKKQKMSSVLDAFINGHIQVRGDLSQLMALQIVKFSDEQRMLYQSILEQTKFT